jgi:hypothetical protein
MVFASGVAIYGFFGEVEVNLSCEGQPLRGANIGHAVALAFFGGLAALVVTGGVRLTSEIFWPRYWRPLLAAVLLLEAATLGLAIALVALDSSTWIQQNSACGLGFGADQGTSTAHFGYLYILWAVPLALILVAVGRLFVEISRFGFGPEEAKDERGGRVLNSR